MSVASQASPSVPNASDPAIPTPNLDHATFEPFPGPLAWLGFWITLAIAAAAALWLTGYRDYQIASAIQTGERIIEFQSIGERDDQTIREAIRVQRASIPFWTTLRMLTDFVFLPLGLAARALAAATLAAAWAAIWGRPHRFADGWRESAAVQGFWAVGLALQTGLIIALGQPEATFSAALWLDPTVTQPAWLNLSLRWLDGFALAGWIALAWGIRQRGQAGISGAVLLTLMLMSLEFLLVIPWELVLGAGMRLTVVPQ